MIVVRPLWLCLAIVVLGVLPEAAQAHLVNTGFGPFYDGISYLFLSPANLVVVLGIAIVAGLRGTDPARTALFLLTGAWLLGAAGARELLTEDVHLPVVVAVMMLGIGLVAALDLPIPAPLVAACAVGTGLLLGVLSGAAMAQAGGGLRAVMGVVAAVFTVGSITAAVVVTQGAGWRRIAVRVAGSWITAIGLLMAGWALRAG